MDPIFDAGDEPIKVCIKNNEICDFGKKAESFELKSIENKYSYGGRTEKRRIKKISLWEVW